MTARTLSTTREDYVVAWLAALAIAIHIIESALPSPLPGVKPGLANVVTVAALILYGWRVAVWVSVLRVIAGSMLIGTFLSPTFVLSLSGALAALLAFLVELKRRLGVRRKTMRAFGLMKRRISQAQAKRSMPGRGRVTQVRAR